MRLHKKTPVLLLLGALALGGCDLDLQDPNLPTEDKIVTTVDGISQIAIGLQAELGNELVDPIYVAGMVTDELGAGGATFEWAWKLDSGESIDNDVGPAEGPWAGMYDVVQVTNVLIENTPKVGFGPATQSGILALAKLYKAMAFGSLLQTFERIPLEVGPTFPNPTFADRQTGLDAVLSLLAEARGHIQATPPSAEFNQRILAPGFDLANTIDAMTARYALIAGKHAEALTAAQRVDLNVSSEFRFTNNDVNPLWNMWYNSGNAYQLRPKDIWRLAAQDGDQRVDFWVTAAETQGKVSPLDDHKHYASRAATVPAYIADEMRLIMAEVHARQNNLGQALSFVNDVRTDCAASATNPAACLPALTSAEVSTQQTMLDAILRERRYELYLQGVSWSDLRRFGKPVKYAYMPIPRSECERNAAAPLDLCGSR